LRTALQGSAKVGGSVAFFADFQRFPLIFSTTDAARPVLTFLFSAHA
jgi:hypothetical protein